MDGFIDRVVSTFARAHVAPRIEVRVVDGRRPWNGSTKLHRSYWKLDKRCSVVAKCLRSHEVEFVERQDAGFRHAAESVSQAGGM